MTSHAVDLTNAYANLNGKASTYLPIFTMDDWQDAAFSTRHMHNRTGRGGGKSKLSAAFDVRKTFASYEVKCPAWQKALTANGNEQGDSQASLELYRLTEGAEGVVGELMLPGVLHTSIILAGSRESLRRTIGELEPGDEEEDEEDLEDSEDEEEQERDRFETFSKNSFRSPKFWFRWSGAPTSASPEGSKAGDWETELGYVVFSGNDCRKFKGTINCESLKWKNVAITGHKIVARSESDTQVTWGKGGVVI
jgi:hypothetical protein